MPGNTPNSKSIPETKEGQNNQFIHGGPTKRFFVSMLPRDIDLADAILDLVDNCIDGAMRQLGNNLKKSNPFEGFRADLTVKPNKFEIRDNCGGIPNRLIEVAFLLGRKDRAQDEKLPTIGMYGIGMKRSIFKIAQEAMVASNSKDSYFEVHYTRRWLSPNNDDWALPIERTEPRKGERGVTILVMNLKPEVSKQFNNDYFINKLKNMTSEHFAYLMQKGFSVTINGEKLKPKALALLYEEHSEKKGIRPFDFETTFNKVDIKVTIGFYRPLVREAEIDAESEGRTNGAEPGISVVCNDRVVLLNNTGIKTGWGDGAVPRFHPQFRAIAGIIIFTSSNPENLPISTTKRDLDANTDVFFVARKATMEGLKLFTDFTNKWKGIEEDTNRYFRKTTAKDAGTKIALAKKYGKAPRGETETKKYVPDLPFPEIKNPRRRISFVRNQLEIRTVSKFLFNETDEHPSIIGAECFDRFLTKAKKK